MEYATSRPGLIAANCLLRSAGIPSNREVDTDHGSLTGSLSAQVLPSTGMLEMPMTKRDL
jgi:hypothetical protein